MFQMKELSRAINIGEGTKKRDAEERKEQVCPIKKSVCADKHSHSLQLIQGLHRQDTARLPIVMTAKYDARFTIRLMYTGIDKRR